MKALNDNHKKWILTASLASLLSLNLVMSLSGNTATANTIDFASTSSGVTLDTKRGPIQFKISATADGKSSQVETSPKDTEAGSQSADCPDCRKFIVAQEYNLENLGIIASKALKKFEESPGPNAKAEAEEQDTEEVASTKAKAKAKAKAGKADVEDEDDSVAQDEGDAKLAELETKCKKFTEQSRRMQCLGTGLAKLLNSDSEISEDAAVEVWQKSIRKGMIASLLNPSTHKRAQIVMEKLLKEVDREKYDTLRKEVLLAATQAVIEGYKDAQDLANEARYSPNAKPAYMAKLQEADSLRNSLRQFTDETLVDREDIKMKRDGYRLPTQTVHEAMVQYKPYQELRDVNADVYTAGTGYTVTPMNGGAPINSTTGSTVANSGRTFRQADAGFLQQNQIRTVRSNVTPGKIDPGTVLIGNSGGQNGGTITRSGTAPQQLQQGQPGRVMLPPAPGAGMIPQRQ